MRGGRVLGPQSGEQVGGERGVVARAGRRVPPVGRLQELPGFVLIACGEENLGERDADAREQA